MFTLDNDKPKEECGVFGIFNANHEDVSHSLYYGLCALQHRGQESAGMAVCDTEGPLFNLNCHKNMGLVTPLPVTATLKMPNPLPWIILKELLLWFIMEILLTCKN